MCHACFMFYVSCKIESGDLKYKMNLGGEFIPIEILAKILESADALSTTRFRATCRSASRIPVAAYRFQTLRSPINSPKGAYPIPEVPIVCETLMINSPDYKLPDSVTADCVTINSDIIQRRAENMGLFRALQKAKSVVVHAKHPDDMYSSDTYPTIREVSGRIKLSRVLSMFPNLQTCYIDKMMLSPRAINDFMGQKLHLSCCGFPSRFTFHGTSLTFENCDLGILGDQVAEITFTNPAADFTFTATEPVFVQRIVCRGALRSINVSFAMLYTQIAFDTADVVHANRTVVESGVAQTLIVTNVDRRN